MIAPATSTTRTGTKGDVNSGAYQRDAALFPEISEITRIRKITVQTLPATKCGMTSLAKSSMLSVGMGSGNRRKKYVIPLST